jgi:hypothetical protein
MLFLLWEGVKRQVLGVLKISCRRLAGNNEVMFTNWVRNFFCKITWRRRGDSMAVAGWGGRWQQHAKAWPAADGRDVASGSSSWRWSPEFAVFCSGVSAVLPMHNK